MSDCLTSKIAKNEPNRSPRKEVVEAQELGQQEQAPATSSYRMSDLKVGVWGFWNAALRRPGRDSLFSCFGAEPQGLVG